MKRTSLICVIVALLLVYSPYVSARSGKTLLGGEFHTIAISGYNYNAGLSFHVTNPNDVGTITITGFNAYYPDGSAATLKASFPLPVVINPHEVYAFNMVNFFNPVPPQASWHPETYTFVISWNGDVENDLIAISQTDYTDSAGEILTIIKNQFENRSMSEGCITTVPSYRWKGEYFPNKILSGSPLMVRDDGNGFINFDWGTGSPSTACGIGLDNFSVRWTRTVLFNSGTYRFTVRSDDGFRLYVDGSLKLDGWCDQPPTNYFVDIGLSAGNHTVMMEYYENAGGATASLSWSQY